MKLTKYTDIVDSDDLRLHWKGNEYYPAEEISATRLSCLRNITAYRIWIDGAGPNRDKYEKIYDKAYELLLRFLFMESVNIPAYLFVVENDPHIPSRVRSYRGIVPKKELEPDSYFEREIKVSENKTLIIAVVRLTKDNFSKIIGLIGDDRKGFLFQGSSERIFSPDLLSEIVSRCLRLDFIVSYSSLLELMWDQLGCVYRFSGDFGDTFLGIDIFFKGNDLNVASRIEKVTTVTKWGN